MDSDDDDLFSLPDDELQLSVVQTSNPVEDHLLKQLTYLENKIQTTANNIDEMKTTTAHILNLLEQRALYGDDVNSTDSDNELYTVDAEPVIKKRRHSKTNTTKNLEVIDYWQCVLCDKWIIGIELQNKQHWYYPWLKNETEVYGESAFWQLRGKANRFWEKIDSVDSNTVYIVATMLLDLPAFDRGPVVECWGVISYEIDEVQFQTPVPSVQISVTKTIDSSMWTDFLNENVLGAILALKSSSNTEKIVNVQFSRVDNQSEDKSEKQLLRFLLRKFFRMIVNDVYLVSEQGCLMNCLIEILSINREEMRMRIFARSVSQLNIMLHLLRESFPNVADVEKTDNCTEAATALMRELKMIRDGKSDHEIQTARLITDLLIP